MSAGGLRLVACALAALVLSAAGCGPRVLGRPVPPRESAAVRAELAAVLLNAGRYDEATREYRRLVEIDPGNFSYRLSLARALAWNGRHREAEAHLRLLWARRPGDATVDALLRQVRANLTPGAAEAEGWVAERPNHAPYRLALARALVREGRASLALVHYDALLAGNPSDELLRETVAAYAAARDRRGAIATLQRHLRGNPRDPAVRRQLANVLAEGGELSAALAHADTAFAYGRSPLALVDRARIHLLREDEAAAEADLRASLEIAPTTEAYLALGDLLRWRYDFTNARQAYEVARSLSPRDAAVTEAFAHLARDERPALASVGVPGEESEWGIRASALRDNGGIRHRRLSAQRGFGLPRGFQGSLEVDYRELRESTPEEELDSRGIAAELALARSVVRGPLAAAIGARAGVVQHFGEDPMALGAVAVRGAYHAWTAKVELAEGPAYPTLLTVASLTGGGRAADPLRERVLTLSAAGPVGDVDAAVVWHRADISDGNRRSGMNLLARYPVAPRLAFLYSGTTTSYVGRSQLYWDPEGYLGSTFGLEVAERRSRGLSYALRVLPGMARSEESPFVRGAGEPDDDARMRLQFAVGANVGYRREHWDVAAAVGFGRVSRYERTDAAVTVRIAP